MRKQIKITALILIVCLVTGVLGCAGIRENTSDISDAQNNNIISDWEIPVIVMSETTIFLDEVRYYAYNTQATYEVYYLTENIELDWEKEMEVGVPLDEGVKISVLDEICKREAMISYADDYQIELTEEEMMEITKKANQFYWYSDPVLLAKINITGERLEAIFAKDALSKKVSERMEQEETGKSEVAFKKWRDTNTVTTNEYWDAINFDTPIFSKEN